MRPKDCHFKQLEIYPFDLRLETPIEVVVTRVLARPTFACLDSDITFPGDRGAVSPPTRVLPKIELEPRNTEGEARQQAPRPEFVSSAE